jgi:hypothetical protein
MMILLRPVIYLVCGLALLALLPIQLIAWAIVRRSFSQVQPYKFLFDLLGGGAIDESPGFDKRFVLFHHKMDFGKFKRIYIDKAEYETTPENIAFKTADTTVIPHLGVFDYGEQVPEDAFEAHVSVPSDVVSEPGEYFALIVVNQSRYSDEINDCDYLIFRTQDALEPLRKALVLEKDGGVALHGGEEGTGPTMRHAVSPESQKPIRGVVVGSAPR